MKILLVNTNRYRHLPPPPVGLAFISAALKSQGHEVRVCDLMFSTRPERELSETMDVFRPQATGFSVRNLDNQDMLETLGPLPEIKRFVGLAKARGIPTIIGGTAFTTFPREMLRYMEADYGVAGQGEGTIGPLVDGLQAKRVDPGLPGLAWRDGDEIRCNPPAITGYRGVRADWDALDLSPYRSSLMPVSVVTKTGCPYECSYCDARTTFGARFFSRDPEEVADDIQRIQQTKRISVFFLTDPVFNTPLAHAKRVLGAICERRLKVSLSAIFMPLEGHFDDELFELFRRAGGRLAMVGTESLSNEMLARYKKPFRAAEVVAFCQMAHRHGIVMGLDGLFGGPGETPETVRETIDGLAEIPYAMFIYGVGVRILPGCEVFHVARREGLFSDPGELMFPRFYVSPGIDAGATRQMLSKGLRRYAWRRLRLIPYGIHSVLARYLNWVV